MEVIRLKAPGVWEKTVYKTFEKTTLKPNEVLVKVNKMGVCGTDLHAFKGNQPFFDYPRVLGHELAVEVTTIGSNVSNVSVGDRCSLQPFYNESDSQEKRNGKPNCGDHLRVYGIHQDGGMMKEMILPAYLLHKSNVLTDDQLTLIEPLSIGCHAVDRANITHNDIVLVIGVGPIGLACIQFAQLTGARVIAMDISNEKLELAKKITQVKDTVKVSGTIEEDLKAILNGDLPTIVLDATGNPKSMLNTFNIAAAGGTIVFVGLFQGDVVFNDPYFHKKELTLKASRASLAEDFQRIIRLVEAGKITPENYITHRMGLQEVPEKFEKLYDYGGALVKAVIDFN